MVEKNQQRLGQVLNIHYFKESLPLLPLHYREIANEKNGTKTFIKEHFLKTVKERPEKQKTEKVRLMLNYLEEDARNFFPHQTESREAPAGGIFQLLSFRFGVIGIPIRHQSEERRTQVDEINMRYFDKLEELGSKPFPAEPTATRRYEIMQGFVSRVHESRSERDAFCLTDKKNLLRVALFSRKFGWFDNDSMRRDNRPFDDRRK